MVDQSAILCYGDDFCLVTVDASYDFTRAQVLVPIGQVWCMPERCYVYDSDEYLVDVVNPRAITCLDKICKYGAAEPVVQPPAPTIERPYPWN